MLTRRRAPRARPEPRRALADVLAAPRYEVLPLPGIEEEVAALVPPEATVTVTASPRRGMAATLETAGRLAAQGVRVVPHLSARLLRNEAHLKDVLDEVLAHDIHEVFVIGGDADEPAGEFAGSLDVLLAMDRLGYELVVGIAGYPEAHPKIPDDLTVQAMWDKRHYASYIVSQICFRPPVVVRWVERVRRRGIALPIYVGVPGPARTRQLLSVSRRIGVGESTRVLAHHGRGMLRLAQSGEWRPDSIVDALAPYLCLPHYGMNGPHMYTFNDVEAAERWRRSWLARTRPSEEPAR
jgi:methylenetetrahydrofolate reductase (NADPH)